MSKQEVIVCKTFRFSAAHQLPDYDGPCARVHGHTFWAEVRARGGLQEGGQEKGMVVDFSRLKAAWRTIEPLLDHQLLNDFIDYPTTERVAHFILDHMRESVSEVYRVRLWEGAEQWAEARASDPIQPWLDPHTKVQSVPVADDIDRVQLIRSGNLILRDVDVRRRELGKRTLHPEGN